jgi:hypothetical protein
MVTDGQVRKLFRELAAGTTLAHAARRAGMDEKTARTYRASGTLPTERKKPRLYRTRPDPFVEVWPQVAERLQAEPRLRAKTLFDWVRAEHPGRFTDGQRRTFERRVQSWRALTGPGREVVFRQVHAAGDLAASDFTSMTALGVTIAGQPFDHLVYHFVLTDSNWESVSVCASESFEALSEGLQNAFWELGGVPRRHRSDSLSAAVNNLSAKREFQTRYHDLLEHYGVRGERINVRQPHENGDSESSHGHFKTAVDQALLMRGSRDFASREEYVAFLRGVVATRNAGRGTRLAEELAALRPLPAERLSSWLRLSCRVDSGSLIHIHRNVYSVHSRLIGHEVEARLYADRVEVWYAGACVDTLPRLVGRDRHAVHYRHIIDRLVRKPGAFANYRYRDDLFPNSRFRLAHDRLRDESGDRVGTKEYLRLLQHAARDSEVAVDDALRVLLSSDTPLSAEAVIALARRHAELPAPTDVTVDPPDLRAFDALLSDMEVTDGEDPTEHSGPGDDAAAGRTAARATEGTAAADVPRPLPGAGGPSSARGLELPAVPGGVGEPGVRGPDAGQNPTAAAPVALARRQDLGPVPVGTRAAAGDAPTPDAPRRDLPRPPRERVGLRQARFWKNASRVGVGRATGSTRPVGVVRHLRPARAGTARRQTRPASGTPDQTVERLRGVDHRRPGLRPTEPRRDGGVVHASGGTVRTGQRAADEQPAVLTLGGHLQGPDDDGGRHRPLGSPQCDRGIERAELSTGCRQGDQEGVRRKADRSDHRQLDDDTTRILMDAHAEI